MLRFVRKGDVVHVTKLDRLGRSMSDLKSILSDLEKRGVDLKVLDQPIDTTTPLPHGLGVRRVRARHHQRAGS